jgi:hypothetical protein
LVVVVEQAETEYLETLEVLEVAVALQQVALELLGKAMLEDLGQLAEIFMAAAAVVLEQ